MALMRSGERECVCCVGGEVERRETGSLLMRLLAGNRAQAMEFFQKCVDVTPEMARQLMMVLCKCLCLSLLRSSTLSLTLSPHTHTHTHTHTQACEREGVRYIVAPYEADAQLAFLALNGHAQVWVGVCVCVRVCACVC
jgi:5'-3' exonuclease